MFFYCRVKIIYFYARKNYQQMKSFLSWSSGKDAAFTLHQLIKQNKKPDLLLTTVNRDFQRVSMHGLRIELLEKQAEMLDMELYKIPLAKDVSMKNYNRIMEQAMLDLKQKGFNKAIFGDIFLEDLKDFRIEQMKKVGFECEFPIWKRDTKKLAVDIIESGINTLVVSINSKKLDKSFVGRKFNRTFLNELPENVDWCGENGEFHTFVYDHPDFKSPIDFVIGEKIFKTYKPCSKSDQNSYKKSAENTTDKWDTGFWYVEVLIP